MEEKFEFWAILELMGHRRLAGYVTATELAAHGMLRIDIPTAEPGGCITQYYSPSSMYALSPTTEELARAVATRNRPEPVHVFELSAPPKRELDNDDKCSNCHQGDLFFNDDGNIACHGFSGREVDGCGLVVKKKDEPAVEDGENGGNEPV
jgi:hypothetical protein